MRRSVTKAILSTKYPQFAARLRILGYEIIPTEEIPCDMPYERDHADLQCLILNDTAFVLKGCQQLSEALSDSYQIIECGERFAGSYPDNVVLSAVKLSDSLICRVSSLDDKVKAYCFEHDIKLLNVNQGYAKCACAQVSDHAIIAADPSIIQALSKSKIDALPIGKGSVKLSGAEYGFIGGASGYDSNRHTLFFCGDISRHPDYRAIKHFCKKHDTRIISLSKDELIDIGGILFC